MQFQRPPGYGNGMLQSLVSKTSIPMHSCFPQFQDTSTDPSTLHHHVCSRQAFYLVATNSERSKNKVVKIRTRKIKSRKELAATKATIDKRKLDALILEDEAVRIMKEVEVTMRDVEESFFYRKLHKQLSSSKAIKTNLKHVLGSNSHLSMVIYAIGSLEFNYNSQYQLAIAMLLRRDFSHWIEGKIEVYDPVMTAADVIAMERLGFEVLSVNEGCRRRVEKPTLFFMPYQTLELVGNLLEANWCHSQINQVILLTCTFSDTLGMHQHDPLMGKNAYGSHFTERLQYLEAIYPFTKQITIQADYGEFFTNIFYQFGLHFFDVDSDVNMENLLPGLIEKRKKLKQWEHGEHKPNMYYSFYNEHSKSIFFKAFEEEKDDTDDIEWFDMYADYRGSSMYRRLSRPPPPGWAKLNFSGKGCDEDSPADYGGIFHSDKKEPLAIYSGSLGDVDATVANVEALRHGLRCLKSLSPPVRKLVVEGNDFSVIRWANRRPQPPVRIRKALLEISRLLKGIKCAIYHTYEESNLPSIVLAKKGAKLDTTRLWISPPSVSLKDKASLPKRPEGPELESPLEANA